MRVCLALAMCLAATLSPTGAAADEGTILADRWYVEPLLYPEAGFRSYTSQGGTLGVSQLGLGAGALFHDLDGGIFSGQARGAGSILTGGGGFGFDVRAGVAWAPRLSWGGARVGFDVFYNQFTQAVFEIPGTVGLDIPVDLILGPRNAYVIFGATPAVVTNRARRVDWAEAGHFGIGHEFEWRIGGGLALGRFGVQLVFSQRTSILRVNGIAYPATSNGVSIGFTQSPYVPPER